MSRIIGAKANVGQFDTRYGGGWQDLDERKGILVPGYGADAEPNRM